MLLRDTVEQYFDICIQQFTERWKRGKSLSERNFTVALSNPTWDFSSKPAGSNATFGAVKDIDTSNQLVTFIPDVVGTYEIEFASSGQVALITINAGLYLGVEGGAVSCKTCHGPLPADNPGIYTKWLGTGHSDMLVRGLERNCKRSLWT